MGLFTSSGIEKIVFLNNEWIMFFRTPLSAPEFVQIFWDPISGRRPFQRWLLPFFMRLFIKFLFWNDTLCPAKMSHIASIEMMIVIFCTQRDSGCHVGYFKKLTRNLKNFNLPTIRSLKLLQSKRKILKTLKNSL